MEKYKANFDDDVRLLDRFGRIDTRTGEYAPVFCRGCDGPLLGHIAEERDCQGPKLSNDERQLLSDRIRQNEQFDIQLMFLDKRPSVIQC